MTKLCSIWDMQSVRLDRIVWLMHQRKGRRSGLLPHDWMEVADYLAPRIASLAAFATRNLTTFLAGILMVSPVAGLRPIRALRLTSTSLPRPGKVKVFLAFL